MSNLKICCLVIGILIIGSFLCHVQAGPAPASNPLTYSPQLAWTVDSWTGDDRPYAAIRVAVFKAMQSGRNPVTLAKKYKAEAAQKPRDPQAIFRYAYATYLASLYDPAFGNTGEVSEAKRAVWETIPTHTYEFTRLHFLMEAKIIPQRTLIPVGERLLRRNPKDVQVKYALIDILNGGMYTQDAPKAKAYAEDLVNELPKEPSVYTAVGSTYFKIWSRTKSVADRDRAIAAYQKYLQIAPPDDVFRSHADFTLKWLQIGHIPDKAGR